MNVKLIKFKNELVSPTKSQDDNAGFDCYAQEDIEFAPLYSDTSLTLLSTNWNKTFEVTINNCCSFYGDYKDPNFTDIKFVNNNYEIGYGKTWDEEDSVYFTFSAYFEKVKLGFGLKVPYGYMAVIFPCSKYFDETKSNTDILCNVQTISSNYQGEITISMLNMTGDRVIIKKGQKICQLVIIPIANVNLI